MGTAPRRQARSAPMCEPVSGPPPVIEERVRCLIVGCPTVALYDGDGLGCARTVP